MRLLRRPSVMGLPGVRVVSSVILARLDSARLCRDRSERSSRVLGATEHSTASTGSCRWSRRVIGAVNGSYAAERNGFILRGYIGSSHDDAGTHGTVRST
jgi:hypothetical protein